MTDAPTASGDLPPAANAVVSGRPFIVALLDPSAPCHDDCRHPDLDHRTAGKPCRTPGGETLLRDPAIISREAFAELEDREETRGARSAAWALIARCYQSDPAFGEVSVETHQAFAALVERGGAIPLPDGREVLVSVSTYIGIVQMIEDARLRPKRQEYRSSEERKGAILRVFNATERGESLMCDTCRHTERVQCWCVRTADSAPAEVIPLGDMLSRAAAQTRRVVGVVIAEDPHADRGIVAEVLAVDGSRRWWRQDALRPRDEPENVDGLVGGLVIVRDADAPAWARTFFDATDGASA